MNLKRISDSWYQIGFPVLSNRSFGDSGAVKSMSSLKYKKSSVNLGILCSTDSMVQEQKETPFNNSMALIILRSALVWSIKFGTDPWLVTKYILLMYLEK